MKIGQIEAKKGEKAFGFLEATRSHALFPAHIPLHIISGVKAGPTLLVQAGLSGLEIEPAMVLPHIVSELDPQKMSGTVILVPLLNTSGFEFEQEAAIWDGKKLNALGRGNANGSVSEQLIHCYYKEVVTKADAVIDFHTGALWGYFRYAGVYRTEQQEKSQALAVSLGLSQVLIGQPEDHSLALEAAKEGKAVASVWVGGGPGLRDNKTDDHGRIKMVFLNAMKHLGIIDGLPKHESQLVDIIEEHTVLKLQGSRGFTFLDKNKRGKQIDSGEMIGYVRDPFTGETIEEIRAPRPGIMLHAGAVWPIVPEDAILAILGDRVVKTKLE